MTDNSLPESEARREKASLKQFIHHQRRAYAEMGKALEALLPPDFRKHSAQARREYLQSFRVLWDVAAEGLERAVKAAGNPDPGTAGNRKVRVDVE